jgi:hypothetical protein
MSAPVSEIEAVQPSARIIRAIFRASIDVGQVSKEEQLAEGNILKLDRGGACVIMVSYMSREVGKEWRK